MRAPKQIQTKTNLRSMTALLRERSEAKKLESFAHRRAFAAKGENGPPDARANQKTNTEVEALPSLVRIEGFDSRSLGIPVATFRHRFDFCPLSPSKRV